MQHGYLQNKKAVQYAVDPESGIVGQNESEMHHAYRQAPCALVTSSNSTEAWAHGSHQPSLPPALVRSNNLVENLELLLSSKPASLRYNVPSISYYPSPAKLCLLRRVFPSPVLYSNPLPIE